MFKNMAKENFFNVIHLTKNGNEMYTFARLFSKKEDAVKYLNKLHNEDIELEKEIAESEDPEFKPYQDFTEDGYYMVVSPLGDEDVEHDWYQGEIIEVELDSEVED